MNARIVILLIVFLSTSNPLSAALVAQYNFSGNANDTSGNGHDGTVFGAILTSDRFGNPNSAYSFDGIDDYISVAYSSDFQISTYTVSAWFRPTVDLPSLPTDTAIVTRGEDVTSDNAAFFMGVARSGAPIADGAYFFYEDDGGNDYHFNTGYNPRAGAWTHFAATRTASDEVNVYLNGQLINSWSPTAQPTTNSFQDLLIGAYWSSPSSGVRQLKNFFPGSIDEVMIYDHSLSLGDIRRVSGIPAPSAVVLGIIGVGVLAGLRRRRMM